MANACEKQNDFYILMDVGGTQIKGAVLDYKGNIIGDISYFPANAREDKTVIFDNFVSVIKELQGQGNGWNLVGIGMAFPGPFDYQKGISLMQGLNKYDSIYGIPIVDEIKNRMELPEYIRFCFLHDVEAFAIGVSWFGEAKSADKILCLCIGTGAGSAFIEGKKPLKEKRKQIPLNGWIYDTPFRASILDDYLSVRGLEHISFHLTGKKYSGRELYDLCTQGNEKARKVFRLFGETLTEGMLPFLEGFQPDAVVLGGQISKSFSYFGEAFEQVCEKRKIKIYLEQDTSLRAIQGLYKSMEQEERG